MLKNILAMSVLFALTACGGGGGGGGNLPNTGTSEVVTDPFEINNAESFSDALDFIGGQRHQGTIPSPSSTSNRDIDAQPEVAFTKNSNSELTLEVPLENVGDRVYGAFIQVDGTGEYFFIPVDTGASVSTTQSFSEIPNVHIGSRTVKSTSTLAYSLSSVNIASNVQCIRNAPPCESLKFTAYPLVDNSQINTSQSYPSTIQILTVPAINGPIVSYGNISSVPSNWTKPSSVNFSATPVGTGDIQVTLTWDNDADVDLYVIEPDGNKIYYSQKRSSSGGYLDVDDMDGFGPENIFYENIPPAGTYEIKVDHYSGGFPSNYTINLSQNSESQTFTGTLTQDTSTDVVAHFTVGENGGVGQNSELEDLSVSGRIRNVNGSPISDVKVAVQYIRDSTDGISSVMTDSEGKFDLDLSSNDLPDHFLVILSKAGYVPLTISVDKNTSDSFNLEEVLTEITEDIYVVEIDPALHHLGDDSFDGVINSQFQVSAEGISYSRSFSLSSLQAASISANLTLTAKGLQNSNKLYINGVQIGLLNRSPSNGSFREEFFEVPKNLLGLSNTIEIIANLSSSTDYDDFEFTNIVLNFDTTNTNSQVSTSLRFSKLEQESSAPGGKILVSGAKLQRYDLFCLYGYFRMNATITGSSQNIADSIAGDVYISNSVPTGNFLNPTIDPACPGSISASFNDTLTLVDTLRHNDSENRINAYSFSFPIAVQNVGPTTMKCNISSPITQDSYLFCGFLNGDGQWNVDDMILD